MTFRKNGVHVVNRDPSYERLARQRASILECSGCHDRIVVVEDQYVGGVRYGGSGGESWRGIHWWPTPGITSFGAEVPANVADAYG